MEPRVTAYLCCEGASDAIDFYKRAFGAVELSRMPGADGRLGHAEIRIGETVLFVSDDWPEMNVRGPKSLGGSAVAFVLNVPDVEETFAQAMGAGATVERPISDQGFGRMGWIHDPWGHRWAILTESLPP